MEPVIDEGEGGVIRVFRVVRVIRLFGVIRAIQTILSNQTNRIVLLS